MEFQFNRLEYFEEAITLYGTYNANSIDEILDVINYLHKKLSKYERIISGRQCYRYKGSILERIIAHTILNS